MLPDIHRATQKFYIFLIVYLTGCTPQSRGIVTFISDKWEDEYMCLYTADKYIGEIGVCDEGELVWVEKDKIKDLNIWEGDKIFLRLLAENELFFSLKLEYQGENLINAILNGKEYN